MTVYRRGDIVLVNFNPHKRAEEIAKVRPAVIVSDTDLNAILDLVSVVALTTNLIDDAAPLRIRLAPREHLQHPSDAMVEQLRTVAKSRIGQRIASVSTEEMRRIEEGMRLMLGIMV
jgi:mRNA interferase MazF